MTQRVPTPVNLSDALRELDAYWSPRVVGRVNDQYVKVARLKGTLDWHTHRDEDEMFLVLSGRLLIELEDGEVSITSGEFYVVPRGTRHRPVAAEICEVMLIETVTTLHTGDTVTPQTVSIADQLK